MSHKSLTRSTSPQRCCFYWGKKLQGPFRSFWSYHMIFIGGWSLHSWNGIIDVKVSILGFRCFHKMMLIMTIMPMRLLVVAPIQTQRRGDKMSNVFRFFPPDHIHVYFLKLKLNNNIKWGFKSIQICKFCHRVKLYW